MSFLANPDKNDGAQEASGIGSPFLWILSFGEAKESISPAGARTGIKIIVAVATPYCVHGSTSSPRTDYLNHPWHLDSGNPCRNDGFILKLVSYKKHIRSISKEKPNGSP
jgi:hypothetical protein